MNFVNLTQHDIVVVNRNGERVTFPPSGTIALVDSDPGPEISYPGLEDFITISAPTWGSIVGLPEPQDNTVYIVGAIVLEAIRREELHRPDVWSPGTGPKDGAIRNEKGHPIAVTKLIQA